MKTIYVGNIPFGATEEDIREVFEEHGTVNSIKLIKDRETGQFKGFGFIEMDNESADNAISSLDGQDFNGRKLRVNEAKERKTSTGPRGGFKSTRPQRGYKDNNSW